jgi:spore coat protein U-like protein
MSVRLAYGIAFLAFVAGTPSAALAEGAPCSAAIQSVGATPLVQYDPFRGAATATLEVQLVVSGDAGLCSLGLSAAGLAPGSGRSMTSGASEILYRLFNDGVELANDRAAYVPLRLLAAERQTIFVRIEVPAGQIGPAGTYSDRLVLKLVDLVAANAPLGSEASAIVTTAMESRAQVNIAGSSVDPAAGFGLARLDLGALHQGASKEAIVQVRSTAPVTLTFTSQNRGLLQRVGGSDTLAYDLALDGQTLALAAGSEMVSRAVAHNLQGSSYPLTVRIGDRTDLLPAGDYQDLVTIDVVAN